MKKANRKTKAVDEGTQRQNLVVGCIAKAFELPEEAVRYSRHERPCMARAACAYLLRTYGTFTLREIAGMLWFTHHTTVLYHLDRHSLYASHHDYYASAAARLHELLVQHGVVNLIPLAPPGRPKKRGKHDN